MGESVVAEEGDRVPVGKKVEPKMEFGTVELSSEMEFKGDGTEQSIDRK